MTKIFNLNDDSFYQLLSADSMEYYLPIKEALKSGFIPCVTITRKGHISSWYNNHIGKIYEIDKFIVETDNGYINFLVKSKEDGSKNGYKPKFSSTTMGKGLDIVHNMCCEVSIVAIKK